MICQQNVDEIKRIFNKKFPHRLGSLDKFLSVALLTLELIPVPENEFTTETQIRDEKDRLILRAAIAAKTVYYDSCRISAIKIKEARHFSNLFYSFPKCPFFV